MSGLPAPMTPPECDLRGFMEWSRFFGERAFKSHWYRAALKDPRGGLAAIKLWWMAMLECPAGSLPNDDEELCWMADFGQDTKNWRKHRATAMHGFVLCEDNRWYHPFLAEEAITAWERRRGMEHERDVWRYQKRRQRGNGTAANRNDVHLDNARCPPGHPAGQVGGQKPLSTETSGRMSASRAGLEEKEKKREVPPRSPPLQGGRTTRKQDARSSSREDRIVSGGIALIAERLAQQRLDDDGLTDPNSYLRIVEGGRG